MRGFPLIPIVLSAVLALAGCGSEPTYKRESLPGDLAELLRSEAGIDAQVKLLDQTLAVQVDVPNALVQVGQQIGIGPEFDTMRQELIPILHRVIMSSDADLQFYLVLITDSNIPGAYLTLVRNIEDVKRLNVSILDVEEFMSRTVFELNYVGPDTPVDLDSYIQRDVTLSDFLSWQLARRIQQELVVAFAETDAVEVGRCAGQFTNDKFTFTLNVVPTGPSILEDRLIQSSFKAATSLIERVLRDYHFENFSSVRLIHHPTGRDLVLPRQTLNLPY